MKIFFDTEFIEDGRTIELLSIGMVNEDGETYYAEALEADHTRAGDWVKAHVLPHMVGGLTRRPRARIAKDIINFVGPKPEFWAYYCSYDWVVLCQLYGTMVSLPAGWPKLCMDVMQRALMLGIHRLPRSKGVRHNALADAIWAKEAYHYMSGISA